MGHHTDRLIARELKSHVPFTALGASTGIVIMLVTVLTGLPEAASRGIFDFLHPLHVLLSALVTASMYRRYRRHLLFTVLVGYIGSVGIASMSDVIFPYLGGLLVGAEMHFHLPFIEEWWLVNPLALAGIGIALWRPRTRVPHSGHVLLSTWASLFYLTARGQANWLPLLPLIFVMLFVAVWLPCCLSDIIFPLLFVGRRPDVEAEHEHGHS